MNWIKNETTRYSFLIAFIAALLFIPFLGGVHLFDWDEINFAEISREMLLTQDYLRIYINFEPFYQKPPLFFWLQAISMKLFGVNEFAARLPNAICGILTLVLLYNLGEKLYNHRFGIIWTGAYLGSVLPFLYFKSGIIDPYFNLFIFAGLYLFILFYWKKENKDGIELKFSKWFYLFIGGMIIGLGVLTKGPVAYLIAGLTMAVYWVYKRFRFYVNVPQFLLFTLGVAFTTFFWYGLETLIHGPEFVRAFNIYQYRLFSTPDAGHKGFPGYHFVVLLIGCFPASIFAIRAFFKMPEEDKYYQKDFIRWMKYLFWVVLILFSIVQSKIVHYSSMCYVPLTFLSALVIYRMLEGKIKFSRWMKIGLISIASLYALLTFALPIIGKNAEVLKPLFKDPFAQGNLEATVNWTGLEIIPGVFLLIIIIYSIRQIGKFDKAKGFKVLFGGSALFVLLTLIFFIARIEGYSQRAAVEFFESKVEEDCYIITSGYKSYAHLFYSRKLPVTNPNSYDREWLLTGPIDKDLYIATKVHKTKDLAPYDDLVEVGRKNGFVFYKREKKR